MAKVTLLLAAVALAALAVAASAGKPIGPFTVHGKVYCDTCRCGFETNITTYIPNAVVRIECMEREGGKVMKEAEGVTDHNGAFAITVDHDHGDHMCDAVLVSSPWKHCSSPDPGRSRGRVILTDSNGVASHYRHCNSLGFLIDDNKTLPACPRLVNYLLHSDDE